jgi:hypothetical protein
MTVGAALDRRLMQPALVALARAVAGGMAVDAARIGQHFSEFGKDGGRPCVGIGNRGEAFRRGQRVRSGLRSCVTGQQAQTERGERSENPKPRF